MAIVDIVNRGRATVIPNFNRAGGRNPDVGDGFLMKRGFTVVTVGWEFDLPAADMIRIDVPVATDAGRPITGMVRASFTPDPEGPVPRRRPRGLRASRSGEIPPRRSPCATRWPAPPR